MEKGWMLSNYNDIDANNVFLVGKVSSPRVRFGKTRGSCPFITFMVETATFVRPEREEKAREVIEQHKVVCFGDLALRVGNSLSQGSPVQVMGVNRSRKIRSARGEAVSRDVVALYASSIDGGCIVGNQTNMSFVSGRVASDNVRYIGGYVATFNVDTLTYLPPLKKGDLPLGVEERHNIVCFEEMIGKFESKIMKGKRIQVSGRNRSKKISSEDGFTVSRDIVASSISLSF